MFSDELNEIVNNTSVPKFSTIQYSVPKYKVRRGQEKEWKDVEKLRPNIREETSKMYCLQPPHFTKGHHEQSLLLPGN